MAQILLSTAAVCAGVGLVLVLLGRKIVKDRYYKLRGKQRIGAMLLGKPTSYSGEEAVRRGRQLIVGGYLTAGLAGPCVLILIFSFGLKALGDLSSRVRIAGAVSKARAGDRTNSAEQPQELVNTLAQMPDRMRPNVVNQPVARLSPRTETHHGAPRSARLERNNAAAQPSRPSSNESKPSPQRDAQIEPNSLVRTFRSWSSQDNKYHVDAKLVNKTGDKVRLQRRDGSFVEVQIAQLSKPDQEYISQFSDLD